LEIGIWELIGMEVLKISNRTLQKVASILKSGGVVIYPTDTVYGFLADATNKKAVEIIYKIKKRPKSKPVSLFVSDIKMAKELVEVNEIQEKVLKKYWPGKYTFILKRKKGKKLFGVDKNTLAIRIPNHKFLQNLLKKIDGPLVQTSVNISNEKPLGKISGIIKIFGSANVLIIDGGDIKRGKASKIIDLTTKKLTRIR